MVSKRGASIYPAEAKALLLLLTSKEELAQKVIEYFEKILGPAELQSPWHPFHHTPYYEKELGPNLKRCLIGFRNIFQPEQLPKLKKMSRKLETGMANSHQRTINIDPGYVDLFKFVLASGKGGGQKIALTKDVYTYTLLRFEKGKWIPFEWTYPDFKEPIYHAVLLAMRASLKKAITFHNG